MKSNGFTLVELLVVISIIAILSSLLVTGVVVVRRRAAVYETKTYLQLIEQGAVNYKMDHPDFPRQNAMNDAQTSSMVLCDALLNDAGSHASYTILSARNTGNACEVALDLDPRIGEGFVQSCSDGEIQSHVRLRMASLRGYYAGKTLSNEDGTAVYRLDGVSRRSRKCVIDSSRHGLVSAARLEKEFGRLSKSLSGIKNMERLPQAVFVVDTNKERIAIAEANKLKIPVVAIVDTNSDPGPIDFPIPGNDDAIRAIRLFAARFADAIIEARAVWEATRHEQRTEEEKHVGATSQSIADRVLPGCISQEV